MKNEAMTEADFWDSENAIQRSQILQHPSIMAASIELLQQQVKDLQLWQMNMLKTLSPKQLQLLTRRRQP
jgi:hypothetical protein